jgi:hypothetical protein
MTGEGSKRKRVRNRVRKRQRGEVEEADEPQSGTESAENLQVAPKRQRSMLSYQVSSNHESITDVLFAVSSQ